MAYKSTIPAASDKISQSQADILGNFQALAPFGNGYAAFSQQSSDPSTSATQIALYAKTSSYTGNLQLFSRLPSNGNIWEWTSTNFGNYTYLPSGLLLKFEFNTNATNLVNGNNTILFPVAAGIPVFTSTYAVIANIEGNATASNTATLIVKTISATGFTCWVSNLPVGTFKASYIAIGKGF